MACTTLTVGSVLLAAYKLLIERWQTVLPVQSVRLGGLS